MAHLLATAPVDGHLFEIYAALSSELFCIFNMGDDALSVGVRDLPARPLF